MRGMRTADERLIAHSALMRACNATWRSFARHGAAIAATAPTVVAPRAIQSPAFDGSIKPAALGAVPGMPGGV